MHKAVIAPVCFESIQLAQSSKVGTMFEPRTGCSEEYSGELTLSNGVTELFVPNKLKVCSRGYLYHPITCSRQFAHSIHKCADYGILTSEVYAMLSSSLCMEIGLNHVDLGISSTYREHYSIVVPCIKNGTVSEETFLITTF